MLVKKKFSEGSAFNTTWKDLSIVYCDPCLKNGALLPLCGEVL